MKQELAKIANDMKELGLAALSHVNNVRLTEDKWAGILSVLQTAHAMEILAKARIAEEHPLLLFDTYPRPKKDKENKITNEMTIAQLSEKGRTIEWSSIIEMLWLVADIKTVDISAFNEFGDVRNAIQHFGIVPAEKNVSYLTSLSFIYGVIDPFINESWGLFAVDYCQDYHEDSDDNCNYWNYIREYLIRNEIAFKISPVLAENKSLWWSSIKVDGTELNVSDDEIGFAEPIEVSKKYYDMVEAQLQAYMAPTE